MQARNAASVLPEPVGAEMIVLRRAKICGQPASCGSVGVAKRSRNHSRTIGWAQSSVVEATPSAGKRSMGSWPGTVGAAIYCSVILSRGNRSRDGAVEAFRGEGSGDKGESAVAVTACGRICGEYRARIPLIRCPSYRWRFVRRNCPPCLPPCVRPANCRHRRFPPRRHCRGIPNS
jgi:hypothetical protein